MSNELVEIFSNCKFCLTKWLSNSKIIMSFLLKVSYPQNLIVLGILWNINNNTLKLNLTTKRFSDTKRGVVHVRFIGFFESLSPRNKVIDSRFVEEEIKLG